MQTISARALSEILSCLAGYTVGFQSVDRADIAGAKIAGLVVEKVRRQATCAVCRTNTTLATDRAGYAFGS